MYIYVYVYCDGKPLASWAKSGNSCPFTSYWNVLYPRLPPVPRVPVYFIYFIAPRPSVDQGRVTRGKGSA